MCRFLYIGELTIKPTAVRNSSLYNIATTRTNDNHSVFALTFGATLATFATVSIILKILTPSSRGRFFLRVRAHVGIVAILPTLETHHILQRSQLQQLPAFLRQHRAVLLRVAHYPALGADDAVVDLKPFARALHFSYRGDFESWMLQLAVWTQMTETRQKIRTSLSKHMSVATIGSMFTEPPIKPRAILNSILLGHVQEGAFWPVTRPAFG